MRLRVFLLLLALLVSAGVAIGDISAFASPPLYVFLENTAGCAHNAAGTVLVCTGEISNSVVRQWGIQFNDLKPSVRF